MFWANSKMRKIVDCYIHIVIVISCSFSFHRPCCGRVCVWTIWRDVICLTCLISRLLGLTLYLFLVIICRAPGTHDCLSWPTKTRQHGSVNIPAFSISNFLSWQPAKTRTGVSIIWIYISNSFNLATTLAMAMVAPWYLFSSLHRPMHAIPVRYNGRVFCT